MMGFVAGEYARKIASRVTFVGTGPGDPGLLTMPSTRCNAPRSSTPTRPCPIPNPRSRPSRDSRTGATPADTAKGNADRGPLAGAACRAFGGR